MATEIELSGKRYQIGRLSAMQQFHVSRRIAPIIPSMIPVLMKFYAEIERGRNVAANAALEALASGENAPAAQQRDVLGLVDSIAPVLQPFADALAGLKDEDAEYVFGTCLSVVERQHMNGWAKVWAAAHKTSMFDDMDIGSMLPLVVRVVVENLGPFINGLLISRASSPGAATTAG
ncbi:phage tail assembly chaperone [Burkholderia sp. YIM B11467]